MKSLVNLIQLTFFFFFFFWCRGGIKESLLKIIQAIAQPLYKLQKKNTKFQWIQDRRKRFSKNSKKI